jgi:hypothetical protein
MFLLLGNPYDLCCTRVASSLRARGHDADVIENPLTAPARLAWQMDDRGTHGQFRATGSGTAAGISGVLVRTAGWLDPRDWSPQDFPYAIAETQAALLAWLCSLSCPVVNRYDAGLWYRPRPPLAAWRPLLSRSGLEIPSMLITNVPERAREFGARAARRGAPGLVYAPLSGTATYLVATDRDWAGLDALQARTPISVAVPHEEPERVLIVGDRMVWNATPSREAARLEPRLRQFARDAALTFVEVAVAPTADGIRVIAVDHQPHLETLDERAQTAVVDELVGALTRRPS